jgi:hypothetical protein
MKKLAIVTGMILAMIFYTAIICHSQESVIHACYQQNTGQLRYVTGPSDCKNKEVHISWPRFDLTPELCQLYCLTDKDYPPTIDEACETLYSRHKLVFISSWATDGAFGGLIVADAKCNELAEAAGWEGTFKAWLSDSQHAAVARMNPSCARYVDAEGTVIANGTGALEGKLKDIKVDEQHNKPFFSSAWVGEIGQSGYNCVDWTSDSLGDFGRVSTGGMPVSCHGSVPFNPRIICVQQ